MVWSLESGRLGIGGGGSFSEGRAQAMYDSAFTACPVYSLCTTANFLFFFLISSIRPVTVTGWLRQR